MGDRKHWDAVYTTKSPDRVSWFRPHLDRSLGFLDAAKLGPAAGIIDVGGVTALQKARKSGLPVPPWTWHLVDLAA